MSEITKQDPPHYNRFTTQPWDAVFDWFGWQGCVSHVVKYVARAGRKPGESILDDLRKARTWLDYTIKRLEEFD